jgi:hypothetical protein
MNGLEFIRWSGRRWTLTIAAAMVIQVGLLAWLGRGLRFQSTPPEIKTSISLAGDPWLTEQIQRLPLYRDPTLFALPNLQGFSGSAWLRFTPLENTPRDWTERARTLPLDPRQLALAFQPFAATDLPGPLLTADRPILRITGTDAFVPTQPVAGRSEVSLDGPLAARALLTPSELPSWQHRDILSNSVVQLSVLATGEPFSAVLLSGSGRAEADQAALNFATSARFSPLDERPGAPATMEGPMISGRMIFRWHTLPIVPTNTIPGGP